MYLNQFHFFKGVSASAHKQTWQQDRCYQMHYLPGIRWIIYILREHPSGCVIFHCSSNPHSAVKFDAPLAWYPSWQANVTISPAALLVLWAVAFSIPSVFTSGHSISGNEILAVYPRFFKFPPNSVIETQAIPFFFCVSILNNTRKPSR